MVLLIEEIKAHVFLFLLDNFFLLLLSSSTATVAATAAAAAAAAAATAAAGGDGGELGLALLDELGDVLAVNGGEERLELGVVDLRGDCGSRERGGEKGEVRSET